MTKNSNRLALSIRFAGPIIATLLVSIGAHTAATAQHYTPNEVLFGVNQGGDPDADLEAFPTAPDGFEVTLAASEPVVRNPCSMVFDGRGRLFVGQGPQYRRYNPLTPKDSVHLLFDDDGDGVYDRTHVFATGFNAIQGMAWKGRDLYVANAPDLTIVRDLDGDDVADEYVKLYTDLGNIEHGLHGLNFAPDGRLYMSKGNSKGLSLPGRVAPKAFRELWDVQAPEGSPDIPPAQTFTAETYEATYHDPNDDWGRMGGILRADPDGSNLEILSYGVRNPWDMSFSETFDWLSADNDQIEGDKFLHPFNGSHQGWNHTWSSDWTGEEHLPTVPIVGPLVDGSTTGVIYYDADVFPEEYRGFFVGDWLRKVVYFIKPAWDGARMDIEGGGPIDFIKGGKSLFRATDLEIGPDGAIYVLSWGTTYGAVFEDGEMTNAGRVWRIAWNGEGAAASKPTSYPEIQSLSDQGLLDALDHRLRTRRVDAADELVKREASEALKQWLDASSLTTDQETWGLWTLARIHPSDESLDDWFLSLSRKGGNDNFNTRLQSVRILGFRSAVSKRSLPDGFRRVLNDREPRVRQAAAIAIMEAGDEAMRGALVNRLAKEDDRMVFYSGWQALRTLSNADEIEELLDDRRGQVRLAALFALLESRHLDTDRVAPLVDDPDSNVSQYARSFLVKAGVLEPEGQSGDEEVFAGLRYGDFVRNLRAGSDPAPRVAPFPLAYQMQLYADDTIAMSDIGDVFEGLSYIQNVNAGAYSTGDRFLSFSLPTETTIYLAHDEDIRGNRPAWLTEHFEPFRGNRFRGTAKSYAVFKKTAPAGMVTFGGNTVDGQARAPINYVVMLEPAPVEPPSQATTKEMVLDVLGDGNPARGEWLFKGVEGAACWTCHQVDGDGRIYGPDLSLIGDRDNVVHWIESILEPNAIVTEGYATQVVTTADGQSYAGVLEEESDLLLTVRQATGEVARIRKSEISNRSSLHSSLMPSYAATLKPSDVADLVSYLGTLTTRNKPPDGFYFEQGKDELSIFYDGEPIATYVMRDPDLPRPYFYNLNTTDGVRVTRNFPPVDGLDDPDHATYHPGLWMAFGDLSGQDSWRNRAPITHERFVAPPRIENGKLTFAVENALRSEGGDAIGRQVSQFTFEPVEDGWLLVWDDVYAPVGDEIVFGDQEEMGLGARVATPIIEKNGGLIRTSAGLETAKNTWGKPANWTDYSGKVDGRFAGLAMMGHPENFRQSWWHNRNYGAMASNAFGRKAMRQGEVSSIPVKAGESLRMRYGVYVHSRDKRIPAEQIDSVFEDYVKDY